MKLMTLSVRKTALFGVGLLSLAVGILGIFLPILPTTVFLLISAWCWLRSSDRFYHWLTTNRLLGAYITNYKINKCMTRRQKIFTVAYLWLSIGISGFFFASKVWIMLCLLAVAIGVTVHLLTLKTLVAQKQTESAGHQKNEL